MNSNQKAFTLIELLVVIAIIGILSSVVLANLNGSRQRARDVKRIADVKSLQLALALYFDANAKYPGTLDALATAYISVIPTPPGGVSGVTEYNYVPLNSTCNSYHLGTALEVGNAALSNDSDAIAGTVASSGSCGNGIAAASDFTGVSLACSSSTGADQCFDVTP